MIFERTPPNFKQNFLMTHHYFVIELFLSSVLTLQLRFWIFNEVFLRDTHEKFKLTNLHDFLGENNKLHSKLHFTVHWHSWQIIRFNLFQRLNDQIWYKMFVAVSCGTGSNPIINFQSQRRFQPYFFHVSFFLSYKNFKQKIQLRTLWLFLLRLMSFVSK